MPQAWGSPRWTLIYLSFQNIAEALAEDILGWSKLLQSSPA
jgi:hypothetical protein